MSRTASNGGIPTRGLDIPIDAVFIALFIGLAAGHMTLYQKNKRRGHNFIFNGMLFGFGMSRIAANVFRIAWATRDTSADLALVASIFLNAGIILIYVVNNILAWRLVRCSLPRFGWHPVVRILYRIQLWLVLPMIVMLIILICISVKIPTTYRSHVLQIVARLAQTYFFVLAACPLFWIALALITHNRATSDEFGAGPFAAKSAILALSAFLATVEASYRMGTTWQHTRPFTDPAWYQSKAAFYCFNFMIDVFILATLLVGRVDQRFHVPDGHKGPGSYSQTSSSHVVGEEDKEMYLAQVRSS